MHSRSVLNRVLKNQIERLDKKIAGLVRWNKRLSTMRLIFFIIGTGLSILAAQTGYIWLFFIVLVVSITGFAILVHRHRIIDDYLESFTIWKEIRQTHLSRMNLDWPSIPPHQKVRQDMDHPFAGDLNITGSHSLIHLVDTSIYPGSSERLRQWLLKNDPDVDAIVERQKLVRELSRLPHFRDRLKLDARKVKSHHSEKDWDMDMLLKWLRQPVKKKFRGPLFILGVLSSLNIIFGLLFLTGMAKPYVAVTFVLYLLIYNFNGRKIKGLFYDAIQIEKLLSQFCILLNYLESFPYKKQSSLRSFCSSFLKEDSRPSRYLKKITGLAMAASSQGNDIVWILLNALVPWDLWFSYRLSKYKAELAPRLSSWLDRFYDLEALCSLANFAWLNPDYSFAPPSRSPDVIPFEAIKLGHPLIAARDKVTNDVSIRQVGNIWLITGSNMAGKSTFLRTVGINMCLCFAGGPVNAQLFHTMPFRLFTSINVNDSLDQGLSHFYAEVKRLRRLLDELERPHPYPLFFFVDEIFQGTNNRERLAGSTAYLKKIADKNGIGLISTHDLELARLDQDIPELSNWHFEETIQNGKMSFEYQLKPGPCPTTNALTIMKMEGLPVE